MTDIIQASNLINKTKITLPKTTIAHSNLGNTQIGLLIQKIQKKDKIINKEVTKRSKPKKKNPVFKD